MTASPPNEAPSHCPECGCPYPPVPERNCPGCGAENPAYSVTASDTTPFALAPKRDRRARRDMRRWIHVAGTERLNHLALMRRSPASRSFARRHILALATAAALFEMTHAGWHHVIRTPDNTTLLAVEPATDGWIRLSSLDMMPDDYGCVAVWLNPTRSALAVIPAVIAGLVLAYALTMVMNFGARGLVGHSHRHEERLTAALQYSATWGMPLLYASVIALAVPAADAMRASGVPLVPPPVAFHAVASLLAGVAAFMWWFMLVRLAQTMPFAVRLRITTYYALVAPLLIAVLVVGWRYGMDRLFDLLWTLLKLRW